MIRPVPTLRGWIVGCCGAALLVLAGWFGRVDLLFVGLVLLLAVVGAMIGLRLDRPALSVVRSYAPGVVAADEPSQVVLHVRNGSGRPTPGFTWRDGLPAGIAPVAPRTFPSLAAATRTGVSRGAESATLRYTARAARRGVYLLGPLQVVRTDPLGLARGGYAVGESKVLLVTPHVIDLAPGAADRARGEGAAPELIHRSLPSPDELIPRDYHPGDPLRRVQWRASARLDRLMVRQEEQHSNPSTVLLIDTVSARPGGSDAFEQAVELAASVAAHLLDLAYVVDVHETGAKQLAGPYELPGGDSLITEQLASIEQVPESNRVFADRLSMALRAGRGGTALIVILVDGDEAAWRELAPVRRFAEPAIAFLVGPTAHGATPWLEAAGWACVEVEATTGVAAAWESATEAIERARTAGRSVGRV